MPFPHLFPENSLGTFASESICHQLEYSKESYVNLFTYVEIILLFHLKYLGVLKLKTWTSHFVYTNNNIFVNVRSECKGCTLSYFQI